MVGFWQWILMHNNWVPAAVMYGVMFLWGCVLSLGESSRHKICAFIFVVITGTLLNFLTVYMDGYGAYKNHWKTCAKPEAVAAFYVFDARRERCFKPVVGMAPVDDNNIKFK